MRLSRSRDLLYKLFECVNSDYDTYICDFFNDSNMSYLQVANKYRSDILDKINIAYPDATASQLHYLINLVFGLISLNPVNPLSFHFCTLISNLEIIYIGDHDNIPNGIVPINGNFLNCLCNHKAKYYINIFRNKITGKYIHIGNDCVDVICDDMGKVCKFIHQVLNDYRENNRRFKKCTVCLSKQTQKILGSLYYQTYFFNNRITPYLIAKAKKSYKLSLCIKHI